MAMERLHILVPKGTIKRAKRAAKQNCYDTHSEWLRGVITGALLHSEAVRVAIENPVSFIKCRVKK